MSSYRQFGTEHLLPVLPRILAEDAGNAQSGAPTDPQTTRATGGTHSPPGGIKFRIPSLYSLRKFLAWFVTPWVGPTTHRSSRTGSPAWRSDMRLVLRRNSCQDWWQGFLLDSKTGTPEERASARFHGVGGRKQAIEACEAYGQPLRDNETFVTDQ